MSNDNVVHFIRKNQKTPIETRNHTEPVVHYFPTHYVLNAAAWYSRHDQDDIMLSLVHAVVNTHHEEHKLTRLTRSQLEAVRKAP